MIVSPSRVKKDSPRDRLRYPLRYSTGLTPRTLANLFSSADHGELSGLMELLQELLKDELIGGYADVAFGSLSQRKIEVTSNTQDPEEERAAEVAQFCREILDSLHLCEWQGDSPANIGELPEIIEAVDSSFYFGLSLLWTHWDTPLGSAFPRPVGIELLDQRRYRTRPETGEIALESGGGHDYFGTPISDFDPWLLCPVIGRSLSPRKEFAGIGRSIAFAWHLRFQARLYLLGYAEKFSIPAVVGTFENDDAGAIKSAYDDAAKQDLQLFIEGFMNDAAAIFPPGFQANVIEATRGGHELFSFIEETSKQAIAIAFFGQDGTASGQGGSYAKAYINEKSRQDSVGRRGRRVISYLRKILSYAVFLEFGEEVPVASLSFGLSRDEEKEEARECLDTAQRLGLPITLSHALDVLGLPEPQDGDVLITGEVWNSADREPEGNTE